MTTAARFASLLVLAMVPLSVPVFGQGRNYGRSQVITQQGIAATSQTLASQAAVQILARGGTAVYAALTPHARLAAGGPMKKRLWGGPFSGFHTAPNRGDPEV